MSEQCHKKIGLMGGTFNPIHNGHVMLAEHALTEYKLDEIWFIPSGISWLKSDQNVLDCITRKEMTELAIKNHPKFILSTIEIDREGNSYSYETVCELKKKNPAHEYFFIMGADSLLNVEKWVHPEILMHECKLLVAVRDDCDHMALHKQIELLSDKYNANISQLAMPKFDISSSKIRQLIQKGDSITGMVPVYVEKYIYEHKLYQKTRQ